MSSRRIVAVIAEVIAGAVLGGIVGFGIGRLVGATSSVNEGFGDVVSAIGGAALAFVIAAAAGIMLAGRFGFQQRGSYWLALLGCFIGLIIVSMVVLPLGLAQVPELILGMVATLAPIPGATLYTWSANRRVA